MNYERNNIRKMMGYSSGEQPGSAESIKLNTNENPYPPSPNVLKAGTQFQYNNLRLYPDGNAGGLRRAISQLHSVSPTNVLATRGGDELLRLLVTTFVDPGEKIGMTYPTYSLYPVLAEIQDCPIESVELNSDWKVPKHFASDMNDKGVKLCFLVNPHAPTGSFTSKAKIQEIADELDSILVVDEAYIDFIDDQLQSCIDLIARHDNLIVLRTMSKGYSLAGLRVGYGMAQEELIHPMLTKTKDSYNLDQISQAIATCALEDQEHKRKCSALIKASRNKLQDGLEKLGLPVAPSQANFLLVTIPDQFQLTAYDLYKELKTKNIFVRYFNMPRLEDKLRISVGLPEQNKKLIKILEPLLYKPK